MSNADELSILRRRLEELEVRADSIRAARRTPMGRYVGIVYNGGSIPSSGVSKYHLTHPVNVSGAETEGGAGTLTIDTDQSVPVLIVDGPCAAGDYVIAKMVDGRWAAEEGRATGAATGTLLGCVCRNPPATLYLKVISGGCSLFDDCTLEWGPTPSGLAPLSLGANSYLSTASFADDQTGDFYYWFLSCFSSVVRISRVFETSIFGSPFLDSVAYFWTLGFPGNACSPFSLTNGTDFAGGTCVLHLEETP